MRDGRHELRTEMDCLRSELKGAMLVYDAIAGAGPDEDKEMIARREVTEIRSRLEWLHECERRAS